MNNPDLFFWILLPVSLVAGFIRGFSGFGGPLFMLPVLTQFQSPVSAIWIMLWIDLLSNIRLLSIAWKHVEPPVLRRVVAGALPMLPLGMALLTTLDPVLMKRLISLCILVAALALLSGWKCRNELSSASWVGVGAFSGLVMGSTSIAVPLVLFLTAGKQDPHQVRANFIVWVFVITLALLFIMAASGRPGEWHLTTIAALAPLYVVGTMAGAYVQNFSSQDRVRVLVLLLAALIGGVGTIS